MDFIDYREKLEIGFCDEGKFKYFKVKILNFLNSIYDDIDFDEYCCFCNLTGLCVDWKLKCTHYGNEKLDHCLSLIERKDTLNEFLAYYMALTNSISLKRKTKPLTRKCLCDAIRCMLDESHIPVDLKKYKNEYFIFPKGAKELDDALVSEPLEWLKDYPQAHKTFCIALRQYSEGIYIRDVADNLRKALEAFLQEFLENGKNLETNKKEICRYFGEQGVDAGIAGLFQPLINSYKNINDRIAKHNDAVDKRLLEFLLYQTGILIRMVVTVKKQEKSK